MAPNVEPRRTCPGCRATIARGDVVYRTSKEGLYWHSKCRASYEAGRNDAGGKALSELDQLRLERAIVMLEALMALMRTAGYPPADLEAVDLAKRQLAIRA